MSEETKTWLTLDQTAQRYGVLPSKLLKSGDSIDLLVAQIGIGYEAWQYQNPSVKNDHGFSQSELLDKINRTRNAG